MKKISINLIILISIISTFCNSCKKNWLDAKPDKSLVVPSTIRDYQALLDNVENGNGAPFNDHQSMFDALEAEEFYLLDANYDTKIPVEKANYIWAPDVYAGATSSGEWDFPYQKIFYANITLEGIEKISPTSSSDQLEWNQVKGSALFFRAYNHYNISQLFCKPYDASTATSDLGIPLKTESDINIPSIRSSVQKTYDQILNDLKEALPLVTIQMPVIGDYKTQTRPNKAAVYAMLARVYLSMSNYDSAFAYADKSLQIYNTLMDFNKTTTDILPGGFFRIQAFNKETLYYQKGTGYNSFAATQGIVDTLLTQLYTNNDLRLGTQGIFIRVGLVGANRYVGEYTGFNGVLFTGLATDEIYLIRSECYARKGDTAKALRDLNTLWGKRFNTNNNTVQFIPYTATDANDALRQILLERRKELCFRGLRWTDLRRLNKDPQFAVTLKRVVHGQTYTLPPNSPLYVLPLPPNVIRLSEMQQNPR
jgi:tetratricopeptide (TPR) repeat protein